MDWPQMALVQKRDHRVDHGQARAYQQHRALRVDVLESSRVPRIGCVTGRSILGGGIADGENGDVGLVLPAAGDLDAIADSRPMEAHGFIGDQTEARRTIVAGDFLFQDLLDIAAVKPARYEGEAVGSGLDGAAFGLRQSTKPS